MVVTGIVYSKKYLEHLTGISHPESSDRLSQLILDLEKTDLFLSNTCKLYEPKTASIKEVSIVHDQDYIELVRRSIMRGSSHLDSDTPVSKHSFEVAMLAVGGALTACRIVISGEVSNAFALIRPPGHHAGIRGRALGAQTQGFCIFNNIAIAGKKLSSIDRFQRILILDFDCHHGNGTQEIFQTDPRVLYISIHQEGKMFYPGTGYINDLGRGEGYGYKINLPIPAGSGDDIYNIVYDEVIEKVAIQFDPEIILVSAGFDAHHKDPLTTMGLTTKGYYHLYEKTNNIAKRTCNGRLIAVLEGGYGKGFSKSVISAISALSNHNYENFEVERTSSKENWEKTSLLISNIRNLLSPYWRL